MMHGQRNIKLCDFRIHGH